MAGHLVVTMRKRPHSHCSGVPRLEFFEIVELCSGDGLKMQVTQWLKQGEETWHGHC